jgi:hypothetical protein
MGGHDLERGFATSGRKDTYCEALGLLSLNTLERDFFSRQMTCLKDCDGCQALEYKTACFQDPDATRCGTLPEVQLLLPFWCRIYTVSTCSSDTE